MTWTEPQRCSFCDEPVSLCQCTDNPSKLLGVRLGNTIHEELAKRMREIPVQDRMLFFAGFMATCFGHMSAALGRIAACEIIDALKELADRKRHDDIHGSDG